MPIQKSLLSILFLLIPYYIYADSVSESRALQVAEQFFSTASKHAMHQKMRARFTSETMKLVATSETRSQAIAPAFYIFTPESGNGFVIVSGEDAVSPILAYSYTSQFQTQDMPENIRQWFQARRSEIMDIRRKNTMPTEQVKHEWQDPRAIRQLDGSKHFTRAAGTRGSGTTLHTALWDQGYPYNQECPMSRGEHCLTGCTATAISIVMRYHEYPDYGIGTTSSYKTETQGIDVASRNLSGHHYNWDLMPEDFRAGSSEEANRQVAMLMADVGAAIHADYTNEWTSAAYELPPLISHFGYNSGMTYQFRNGTSDGEWFDMIAREIDNDRPVLYLSASKHAFVIEGYDNQYNLQVNWGWSGYCNGAYNMNNLVCDGGDFSDGHEAVIGFTGGNGHSHGTNNTQGQFIQYFGNNSASYDDNTVRLQVEINNNTATEYVGQIEVDLYSKDGSFKKQCYSELVWQPMYSKCMLEITFPNPRELLEVGDYYELGSITQDFTFLADVFHTVPAFDPKAIDEATSITFNQSSRTIQVNTKPGVSITLSTLDGKAISGAIQQQSATSFDILTRRIPGQEFLLILTRRNERKEVKLSVKAF